MKYIIGLILILILIVIYLIYYNYNTKNEIITIEAFNPYLNYNRIYPSLYSINENYGPYNKSFYMFPDGYYKPSAVAPNYRYYPGYRDYWYIPKHEYLKSWMNGANTPSVMNATNPKFKIPSSCIIPTSTSEYCVDKFIRSTGNLDLAIASCTIPPKVSPACASFVKIY